MMAFRARLQDVEMDVRAEIVLVKDEERLARPSAVGSSR